MEAKRLTAVFLVAIIALAVVAAYGWIRPTTTTVIQGQLTSLADLAKAEGGDLTVYGCVDTPDFELYYKPVFLSLYPWAKVSYLGLSPGELTSRVLSEYQAGHVSADALFQAQMSGIVLMKQQGAISAYNNSQTKLTGYTAAQYDPEGYWHPMDSGPFFFVYNTQLINAGDIPKTYEDLTDPKWRGKIAFDIPSSIAASSWLFAELYTLYGKNRWETMMNGLVTNQPMLTQSGAESFGKVSTGEVSIALVGVEDYSKALKEGLPIQPVWLDPLVMQDWPNVVTNGSAHPYMARLFVEWGTSFSGQKADADRGSWSAFFPALYESPIARAIPPGTNMTSMANEDYLLNATKWSTYYASFGL